MTKTVSRARYTLEFKHEAVRLVEGGQSIAAAARSLGVVDQTLFNWVKAHRAGKLAGAVAPILDVALQLAPLRGEVVQRLPEQALGEHGVHIGQQQRRDVNEHRHAQLLTSAAALWHIGPVSPRLRLDVIER